MEHRAREVSRRPVVRSNEDPAILDLLREMEDAHADRYRRAFEESGLEYGPHVAGTIARKHLVAMAQDLRNLAARANEHARTRNRFDLTDDGIRVGMTRKVARAFIAQDRPYLIERNHPPGCLYGRGGADGTPCDFVVLLARAYEEFCAELDDGDPAPLVAPPPEPEPYEPPTDDLNEARAACEELRARADAPPPRDPRPATELDDIEHDPHAGEPSPEHVRRALPPRVESHDARAAREELRAVVASLTTSTTDAASTTREPARMDATSDPIRAAATAGRSLVAALANGPTDAPPRTRASPACNVDVDALKARDERAQQRAFIERAHEIARREALAKARAKRAKRPRGGRAHLPTQPHPRAALLAALVRLVGPSAGWAPWTTTRAKTTPLDGPPTPSNDDEHGPPLLRDLRTCTARSTARRKRTKERGG